MTAKSMAEQLAKVSKGNLPEPKPELKVETSTAAQAADDFGDVFGEIVPAAQIAPEVVDDGKNKRRIQAMEAYVGKHTADYTAQVWKFRQHGANACVTAPGYEGIALTLDGFLQGDFPIKGMSDEDVNFAARVARKTYARTAIALLPGDRKVFQDFVLELAKPFRGGLRLATETEIAQRKAEFFGNEVAVVPGDDIRDPNWTKDWAEILQLLRIRWNNTVRTTEKDDFHERKMALLEKAKELAKPGGLIRAEELDTEATKRDGFSFLNVPFKPGFKLNGKQIESTPASAVIVQVFSERELRRLRIVDAMSANPDYETVLKGLAAEKMEIPANQIGEKALTLNGKPSRSYVEKAKTVHRTVRNALWSAKKKAGERQKDAELRKSHSTSIHQFMVERKAGATELKVSDWEFEGEDGKYVIDPVTQRREVLDFSIFVTRDEDDDVANGRFGSITVNGVAPAWVVKKFPALANVIGKTYRPSTVQGDGIDRPLKQILSVIYAKVTKAERRREKAAADAAKAAEVAVKSEESGEAQAVVSAA